MTLPPSDRVAPAEQPILDLFRHRWSTRSFDAEGTVEDAVLDTALEAARWAPSGTNRQPWRFVVARRGSVGHERVFAALNPGNRLWAGRAAVLVVALAELESADDDRHATAHYDLGQAVAYLTIQLTADGQHVHQMGGFDRDALRAAVGAEPRLEPVTVIAVGPYGDPDGLDDYVRAREREPRTRRPLSATVLGAG